MTIRPAAIPMAKLADAAAARAYADQVARHRGWRVNPDPLLSSDILNGLATQSARFGLPYCPCRDIEGGPEDQDLVCPCPYAVPDLAEHGQCYCGLFLAEGKASADVTSIPERRASR